MSDLRFRQILQGVVGVVRAKASTASTGYPVSIGFADAPIIGLLGLDFDGGLWSYNYDDATWIPFSTATVPQDSALTPDAPREPQG